MKKKRWLSTLLNHLLPKNLYYLALSNSITWFLDSKTSKMVLKLKSSTFDTLLQILLLATV